ncbi:MAG TPA: alkaline phosphatase D family protein [Kofleriaceae bacterium]|nr:alkaline phosphatase D family protein [Kofleriaceae bacterium]
MSRGTSRRDFLKTIVISAGAVKALPLLGGCGDNVSGSSPDGGGPDAGTPVSFPQSVVSGDPRPTSIVLWTRAAVAAGGDVTVTLEVGTDAELTSLVELSQSEFTAAADADNCVRIKVTELQSATRYYYRFRSGDQTSPVGRFKTAAEADVDAPVRFAVLSCQDYIGRHYNSLVELLDEAHDDIDFVVHLGDYVYETTGDPQFQAGSGRHITFTDQAGAEQLGSGDRVYYSARSLSNYRQLWQTYRADPILQRVHEKFPFIVIWDDHEFVDDCWQDAINYSDGVRVERDAERRRNAEQAFFENQPVALDSETGDGALALDRDALFPNTRLYRDFRFGQHLHLLMTDYRSFRPDHPIPEDGFPGQLVMTAEDTAATPGGDGIPVDFLAPYVDIDAVDQAIYKGALEALLPAAYTAAGVDEERAAALTATAVTGNVDVNVINALLEQIPEGKRPPPIPLEGLPRGISFAAMGKSSLFGQLGSRYLVIKPTYDVYATFRSTDAKGTYEPYGAEQSAWLEEKLDAEPDATWKVLANSTAFTSLIVDLEPYAAQLGGLLPATQLYLDVDQWDGFPAARANLFTRLNLHNTVILSGDIHAAYFTDYGADPDGNRVVEFTGPGVSSGPFEELLRSTAESIPALSGNPLVDVLLSLIDSLLPSAFPALRFSNSKVNGVMVLGVSATELQGTYTMLPGPESLEDQTDGDPPFTRQRINVPKVAGQNGLPVVEEPDE